MKKLLKILVVLFGVGLLFLNVSLTLNDTKVEGFNISIKSKTSAAYWCWWNPAASPACAPKNMGYYCGQSETLDGCTEF